MAEMNADETRQDGMPQGAKEEEEGAALVGLEDGDPDTRIVAPPPPRQRTLTRTAEMDADGEDIDLDADVDDAADSITLELALSPHSSSTPTPSPTTADEDFAQLDNSKPFKVGIPRAPPLWHLATLPLPTVNWASISLSDYCGAIVTLVTLVIQKEKKNQNEYKKTQKIEGKSLTVRANKVKGSPSERNGHFKAFGAEWHHRHRHCC